MSAALSLENFQAQAAGLNYRSQAFINGKYVPSASGKTFDNINPATGKVLNQVAAGDKEDVDRAVKAARAAFEKGTWANMAPSDRKKILIRFADLIDQHNSELALLETLDMGKPIRDSSKIDIPLSAQCIRWYAEAIDKLYDEIAPTGPEAISLIRREPVGVVAAVVPWNFPLLMASWKIGPALAAGNSFILKPAEQSPLTAIRIAELAAEAGIPEGVFNVVPGYGETAGQALGRHMDVDCVAFTGSAEVGKFFLRYAGESNMKRVSLECGGKTPNIIMADCPGCRRRGDRGGLGHLLQPGRGLQRGLAADRRGIDQGPGAGEDLRRRQEAAAGRSAWIPRPAWAPWSTRPRWSACWAISRRARRKARRLVFGGKRARDETGGYYIEPTVFDQVENKMTIAQEEIFGPVLSTITFKTPEEAVKIGNDTIYGLAAAVWTRDITKAFKTARALRAGVVWVNCFDNGHISSPFGGFKQSGFGRDKSLHALHKYTELKATWINIGA